jgi:hypothetical protein
MSLLDEYATKSGKYKGDVIHLRRVLKMLRDTATPSMDYVKSQEYIIDMALKSTSYIEDEITAYCDGWAA